MTDRTRMRVEVALIALIFGGGAGWGSVEWRLGYLEKTVARIDERVAAMFCATVPEPQRAACR